MAQPTTIAGTSLLIKVGDGASVETFAHPCLINADRGIQFSSSNNAIVVPDCADPTAPGWNQATKDGLNAVITGAGVLDNVLATIQAYDTWFRGDTSKNVRVYLGSVGFWGGAFKLTQWGITGARGGKAEVSLTLESEGTVSAFIS
jgi:predicted secreted protein